MAAEKIEKHDKRYREATCPHCGESDLVSYGTYTACGKAEIEVVYNKAGEAINVDFKTGTIEEDYFGSTAMDYQHDGYRCESCGKEFREPNLVPIDPGVIESLKAKAHKEQLEREGQQPLFGEAGKEVD